MSVGSRGCKIASDIAFADYAMGRWVIRSYMNLPNTPGGFILALPSLLLYISKSNVFTVVEERYPVTGPARL